MVEFSFLGTLELPAPGDRLLPASERRAHDQFGMSRCRAYVERPAYIQRLDRFIDGEEPLLVITGPSGVGKSSLLAYWCGLRRREHPGEFIIVHHVGAGSSGNDHIPLLRRVMWEIRERYGIDDGIPAGRQEIEEAFPRWLGRIGPERLLLVIDALDQFTPDSQLLAWLPEYLPPGVRAILSSSGGLTLAQLRIRLTPELPVESLTIAERKEVIRTFLGSHTRSFSREQISRVSADSMSANPLFLRTRLEELRRYGGDEGLNEQIDHYLASADLDDLFQKVLARLEGEFGAGLVGRVMTLIWCSRRGLTEEEVHEVSGADRALLASLLGELEFHLTKRDRFLTFFHDHLREAVRIRYIDPLGAEEGRNLHLELARHFSLLPYDARRAEEEPWQLRAAEAWGELRACLTALPMFAILAAEPTVHELIGYWIALGERFDMVESYRESFAAGDHEPVAPILPVLGELFSVAGRYDAAEEVCLRALDRLSPDTSHSILTGLLDTLATVLYHTGRNEEALRYSRRALELREMTLGDGSPAVARNLADLGAILYAADSYQEAEHLLVRALSLVESHGDAPHVMAMILNNLGATHLATDRPGSAAACFQRALRLNERLLGPEHPEVASNLINIARTLQSRGEFHESNEYFQRALVINEKMLGPWHPTLAVILTNLGWGMREMRDLDDAESSLRRALAIRRAALGPDNVETLRSAFRLGRVLAMKGDGEEARLLFDQAITGLAGALGPDHPEIGRLRALSVEFSVETVSEVR